MAKDEDDLSEFGTLPTLPPRQKPGQGASTGEPSLRKSLAEGETVLETSPAIRRLPTGIVLIVTVLLVSSVFQVLFSYSWWGFVGGCLSFILAVGLAIRSNLARRLAIIVAFASVAVSLTFIYVALKTRADLQNQYAGYLSYRNGPIGRQDPIQNDIPYIAEVTRDQYKRKEDVLLRAARLTAADTVFYAGVAYYLLRSQTKKYFT